MMSLFTRLIICFFLIAETSKATEETVDSVSNEIPCILEFEQTLVESPDSEWILDQTCVPEDIHLSGGTYENRSLAAQRFHNVSELKAYSRNPRHHLTGKGIKVGVWDFGSVLTSHTEFNNKRVVIQDKNEKCGSYCGTSSKLVPLGEHATHVTGTIASRGARKSAQGMAPKTSVFSHHHINDIEEMNIAAKDGVTITNHSYGRPGGWRKHPKSDECPSGWAWGGLDEHRSDINFGLYSERTNQFDKVVNDNPQLSVFVASGNENGVFSSYPALNAPHCSFVNGRWTKSNKIRNLDNHKGGYDTLTGFALSKNVITVGAAKLWNKSYPKWKIDTTEFSGMGPSDDGRIKPDVIALGRIESTYLPTKCLMSTGNFCYPRNVSFTGDKKIYRSSQGTSMATPVVAGIGALLNELNLRKARRVLYADEMKALLIHTAISPDENDAPSYRHGWGLVDAQAAGNRILKNGVLRERINNFSGLDKSFSWNNKEKKFSLTVSWLDIPRKAKNKYSSNIDDFTKRDLVIDLNFSIISPSGKLYYPWSLDPQAPSQKAVKNKPNVVDNVIRFDIPTENWERGIWRLLSNNVEIYSNYVYVAIVFSDNISRSQ